MDKKKEEILDKLEKIQNEVKVVKEEISNADVRIDVSGEVEKPKKTIIKTDPIVEIKY